MPIFEVKGFGRQGSHKEIYRGAEYDVDFVPKIKLHIEAAAEMTDQIVSAIQKQAHTGSIGDGKIFILPITETMRIRTEETGKDTV